MTQILNKDTLVPLSVVGSICSIVVGCAFWIKGEIEDLEKAQFAQSAAFNAKIVEIQTAIKERDKEMDNQLKRINERLSDEWSSKEMEIWILKLQLANPDLKIPDIYGKRAGTSTSSRPVPPTP